LLVLIILSGSLLLGFVLGWLCRGRQRSGGRSQNVKVKDERRLLFNAA